MLLLCSGDLHASLLKAYFFSLWGYSKPSEVKGGGGGGRKLRGRREGGREGGSEGGRGKRRERTTPFSFTRCCTGL